MTAFNDKLTHSVGMFSVGTRPTVCLITNGHTVWHEPQAYTADDFPRKETLEQRKERLRVLANHGRKRAW